MNLVAPVPAVLAGLVLFLMPGLALLSLLRPKDRAALALDERLYLMVSVSVMASAWVALVLAEAGHFSLVGGATILFLAMAIAVAFGRRHLAAPHARLGKVALAPALTVLVLALVLQARPTEYVAGGRDPGTYVAAMAVIARTGGIAYVDPLVLSIPREDVELFYRNPEEPDFSWGRFMGFPLERPQTGRVFPEFFHLFPAFGAYLFQAAGAKGALATPPVFGVLGTLGVFFAFRRILGAAPALLASILLALNVVQVWFARYPVSEPVSQFLIFFGFFALYLFEEDASPAFGFLAGAALGLSLLVRIDSVLIVAPLGIYFVIRRAHRDLPWRAALWLMVPFLVLAGHAVVHALNWSRKYLVSIATRPYWSQSAGVWIAVGLVVLGGVVVANYLGPRFVFWLEGRRGQLQAGVIGIIVTLALYAYFVRPLLSAWAGGDGNPREMALAHPWPLLGLGFKHLAAHDAQAFRRLGWFLSPLGLGLGVFGLVLAIRDWKSRYLFPVLTSLTFALFYFYKIRIWNDYFFALRRFVPVVIPALLGFAALALCRLARGGGSRRIAAAGLSVALAAGYAADTYPLARYVDWQHSVRFVADVARRFGPEDVVVFEQRASIHLLSLPLWAIHGVNVLELARFNPDPERLKHLIEAWRGRYRNIYFVKTYRTDVCGVFLERVEDYAFGTYEWERTFDRPPREPRPRALHFTVSRVVAPEELSVPALPEVDIGGTDDFQVSGFFEKEGGGDHTFRWTGSCASVYFPGVRPGATLVVTGATGQRPADKPAVVQVSLSGQVLGTFSPETDWRDHALTLPDPLPAGPWLLRFDVLDPRTGRPSAWRPSNAGLGSSDTRDLGVMLDRIRVVPSPRASMIFPPQPGGAR